MLARSDRVADRPPVVEQKLGRSVASHEAGGSLGPRDRTQLLQLQIDQLPLAYILLDRELRIIDWNSAAENVFGFSKSQVLYDAPPYEKLVPRQGQRAVHEVLLRIRNGSNVTRLTNENLTSDGRTIVCEWFNAPCIAEDGTFTGMLCLAQDVTSAAQLEEQLRQAQKLEAVGRFAGGIAHDFNNLITIVLGYANMLLESLSQTEAIRSHIEEIRKAAERAANLTRQLLAFSRKQQLSPEIVDLNSIVRDTEKMLRRVIGEDVQLTTVLFPELAPVKVDRSQIQQVLLNLAVNARDAMPKGGALTIATENAAFDCCEAVDSSDMPVTKYVVLTVTDTGEGMTEDVKRRIFEPFFTTKDPDKGTGLGLPVVDGVVKQSGGHIEVRSELGRGTSFMIYLPSIEKDSCELGCNQVSAVVAKGTESVLLVEDDEPVRRISTEILRECGYRVRPAGSGEEAVALCERQTEDFQLLITDVVLPGMTAARLESQVRRRNPGIGVLYVSGYLHDALRDRGIAEDEGNFLSKPYSPTELANKVREVLDTARN